MLKLDNKLVYGDLKTEKKLLYFGADFLNINICDIKDTNTKIFHFLQAVFSISHNTTNANSTNAFEWGNKGQEVEITFSDSIMGEAAEIRQGKNYLFRVINISKDWAKPLNYKYLFRIECYGTFFNLIRLKKLYFEDFFSSFLEEIKTRNITHSVSRIDICADIAGISPKQIKRGISGTRLRKFSDIEKDFKTGEMETFYYGKKGGSKTWHARVYNKKEDCRAKKKEFLYKDYFEYEKVTRTELEIHSEACKEWQVSFLNCLNTEYLAGVFRKLLITKYMTWKIANYVNKELKKMNYQSLKIDRRIQNKRIPLTQEQYATRLKNTADNFYERYEENPIDYLCEELDPVMVQGSKYIDFSKIKKTNMINLL